MKYIFAILLLATLAQPAFSQTTLNFPAGIHHGELSRYGYAVVNPNSSPASVTFTLYNNETGAVLGSTTLTVPVRGQAARLGHQLFGSPNISSAAWVQATSSTGGLQGFFIVGDFTTRVDGAEAASASTELVFPLIGGFTDLNIANPNSTSTSVTMRFFTAEGTEITPSVTHGVAARGGFHNHLLHLPGSGSEYAQAKYLRVSSTSAVVGEVEVGDLLVFGRDVALMNGINPALASGQLNFPHVISGRLGGANYGTILGVTNLSSSQNVTITFFPLSGSPITIQRTIAANGALVETAERLFGFAGGFQNGWVQVTGSAALAGAVAYADTNAGGLAIVPASGAGATNLLFAHIADLDPWWTGVGLLNATGTDAQIEIFAMNTDGSLIAGAANVASARFTLPARSKTARLLSEFIPQTQTRPADGGFIFVRSTNGVPISGMELFFLRSGAAFANVPVGSVPNGAYTPPQ